MKKAEFLTALENELRKSGVNDTKDILDEYEEHFEFKLADGFSESEIAARLGSPAAIAAQYQAGGGKKGDGGRRLVTTLGVGIADLFTGIFYVLLFAWQLVMALVVVACAALAVCLLTGTNIAGIIPAVPYGCAVIYAVCFAALAALSVVGSIYFAAFVRQLIRAYGRFHHNALASASGGATLPPLAVHPQLTPKANRRLRAAALISLAVFAASFVLCLVVSMLVSASFEFWHTWEWFSYRG